MILRFAVCILYFAFTLYSYVDRQNHVTKLKLRLPEITKEIKGLHEEKLRLQYEIDLFESPEHLLSLLVQDEFSHLKYPFSKEIAILEKGVAMQPSSPSASDASKRGLRYAFGVISQ